MISSEFFLALRYLRNKKGGGGFVSLMSFFSFIGIMLGVATLIIVLSVMGGFKQKLMGKILEFNCHLSILNPGGLIPTYQEDIQRIKALPDVVNATALIEDQAMLLAGKHASGVFIRGIAFEDLEHSPMARHIVAGSLAPFQTQEDSILLGRRLAEKLGVTVGDTVSAMVQQGSQSPFGFAPRQKTFTVVGLFDVGMSEYNLGYALIPLPMAQLLFKTGPAVTQIEVNFKSPEHIREQAIKIKQLLKNPHLSFLDWQKRHASFFEAINVERNVMFIILTLIILIAAFNIISGLVMMVKDKTKAIGILRALGLSQGSVVRLFFFVGSTIGLLGTLSGLALGLLFCHNIDSIRLFLEGLSGASLFNAEIYYLSQLPAVVNPSDVYKVTAISLLLTFLAPLYPAWKAAKLKPVEALRYDG